MNCAEYYSNIITRFNTNINAPSLQGLTVSSQARAIST